MKSFNNRKAGVVLPVVAFAIFLVGVIAAALFQYVASQRRTIYAFSLYERCRLAAQSAIEQEKYETQTACAAYFRHFSSITGFQSWFNSWGTSSIGMAGYENQLSQDTVIDGCHVRVQIPEKPSNPKNRYEFNVTFVATATIESPVAGPSVTRTVTEVVRFGLKRSKVFDYAYFVNNYGWFQGGGCTANGDIRANGDMNLDSLSYVNGDAYAAKSTALGASGIISIDGGTTTRHRSISDYWNNAPTTARPTDPADRQQKIGWTMGYDGDSKLLSRQEELEMPYLGQLEGYRELAREQHGTIKQGGKTIIDAVYSGAGPSGVEDAADKGCIVLIGTSSNPLQINGPVVVDKDVVIGGVVTGQGAIYAGRNIHIIQNVTYKNGPSWSHPDSDPEATAERNSQKDLLSLAAKGNIVLGNYTQESGSSWLGSVKNYITNPFVKPYVVDESDIDIGYGSSGNLTFPGNYTANDGLQKYKLTTTTTRERVYNQYTRRWEYKTVTTTTHGSEPSKYYESLIGNTAFSGLTHSTITRVDAALYNNHAVMGKIGQCQFNGALVCRDEAIIYTTSVVFNWDIRLGSESKDSEGMENFIYLPMTLIAPYTISWKVTKEEP